MKKALAFDIGGTKIYSTIVNHDGEIIAEVDKFSTPNSINGIKEILNSQIKKYEKDIDIIAIAIKCPAISKFEKFEKIMSKFSGC